MTNSVKIAVLGLSDAGLAIADGLKKAGAAVLGYDSAKLKFPPVPVADSVADAVRDADVVLSINSATVSFAMAESAVAHLKPGAVFADLNTGTPGLKAGLAKLFTADQFVDAAPMKPVTELAEKTPMAVAGSGAKRFIELLSPLGLELEYVSEKPGDAAARRLLRSIVEKGTAALIVDLLWAAEAMGLEDWALEEIKREFDTNSSKTVQLYLDGTAQHAKRRTMEMNDVTEMLTDAKYESTTVHGTFATLSMVMHGKRVPFAKLDG